MHPLVVCEFETLKFMKIKLEREKCFFFAKNHVEISINFKFFTSYFVNVLWFFGAFE